MENLKNKLFFAFCQSVSVGSVHLSTIYIYTYIYIYILSVGDQHSNNCSRHPWRWRKVREAASANMKDTLYLSSAAGSDLIVLADMQGSREQGAA